MTRVYEEIIDFLAGGFTPDSRTDKWREHFRLDGLRIVGLAEIGEVTVKTLRLNDDDRLLEREILRAKNRFPSAEATRRIGGGS